MKLGLMVGATQGPDTRLEDISAEIVRAERLGFARVGLANIFSFDAITTLALAGKETERIELGTAVVPTYPRHPTAIAQQAMTAQAACSGRFALGIGLSHRVVIEDMLGFSYDKPAHHMREYLEVLGPLLRGEGVKYEGEQYRVAAQLEIPGGTPTPLLVAALGPVMLKLAGRLADGTITWMTGPRTLEEHTGPVMRTAAQQAGRPEPRVVAGIPAVITDDVDAARARIAEQLVIYGQLPSYRAMLDREGLEGPQDIALIGDAATLRAGIGRYRDAGVSDLDIAIVAADPAEYQATLEALAAEV